MSELLERIERDQNLELGELAALLGLTKAQLRKQLEAAAAARATEEKVKRAIAPLAALRQATERLTKMARALVKEADDGEPYAAARVAELLGLCDDAAPTSEAVMALRELANAESLPKPAARGTGHGNSGGREVSPGGLATLRFLADGRKTVEQLKAARGPRVVAGLKVQQRAGWVDWCDDGTWGLTVDGRAVVEADAGGES